ncbi:MAG: arsenate reductase ArsC [Limnochordaceae bacterium]|nr:arsenate reductase ArsC [Limnochordaceae bacterium]
MGVPPNNETFGGASKETAAADREGREGGGRGRPLRILFLCTGNSCRSQMAEGWARALHPGRIEAFSAGTNPTTVHPLAVRVMQEAGVDISAQRSKSVSLYVNEPFDYVVTLCGDARENCPVFPGVAPGHRLHVGFPDPARACGSEQEVLAAFREVRDAIREFVAGLPGSLPRSEAV